MKVRQTLNPDKIISRYIPIIAKIQLQDKIVKQGNNSSSNIKKIDKVMR